MADLILDVFVSHSNSEKEIATDLKQKLQDPNMRVFLAHDDIDGGEDWMKEIYEHINECDVFVILLSKEYHQANFTDQETGIAYTMNKPMIPISLDGTKPYGFMSKYQSTNTILPFSDDKIIEIKNLIYAHTKQGQQIIDNLIDQLANATSFVNANALVKLVFSFTKFSKTQINKIAKAFLENYELRGGWTSSQYITELITQNMKKIDPKIMQDLKKHL